MKCFKICNLKKRVIDTVTGPDKASFAIKAK